MSRGIDTSRHPNRSVSLTRFLYSEDGGYYDGPEPRDLEHEAQEASQDAQGASLAWEDED